MNALSVREAENESASEFVFPEAVSATTNELFADAHEDAAS